MNQFERRVFALEKNRPEQRIEDKMIFVVSVSPGPDGPVTDRTDGWQIGSDGPEIMRKASETDADLEARVAAVAKSTGPGPYFLRQITTEAAGCN